MMNRQNPNALAHFQNLSVSRKIRRALQHCGFTGDLCRLPQCTDGSGQTVAQLDLERSQIFSSCDVHAENSGTTIFLLAIAVFATIAGGSADAEMPSAWQPVAVFGADDRVALPARYQRQQEAIGVLINYRTRSVCTAFCVAEGVIATAGHCLFRTAGEKKPKLADFWFARNYDQVRDYARIAGHDAAAAAQNVIAGSMSLKVSPPIDASSDWALVRLAKPVCTKGVLDFEPMPTDDVVRAATAGQVFQIAYHRDFTLWRQAFSTPCEVARSFGSVSWATIAADFKAPEAVLLHTCDTGGASSGSPLFVETSAGPKVVGINIGTYVQSRTMLRSDGRKTQLQPETIANTAVAVAGLAERVAALKTANVIVTVAGIRDLQEPLKRLGHYDGALDGGYGAGLQRAIEAYETANGLSVTGLATEALRARLRQVGR